MTLNPVVLLFDPVSSSESNSHGLLVTLADHGFETHLCGAIPEVIHCMQSNVHGHAQRSIVVLAGSIDQNCTAANNLRGLYPDLGIAAVSQTDHEPDLIRLLQSGVDNVCARGATDALVVAILFRILARLGQQRAPERATGHAPAERWALTEQDWVLISPQGRRIPLTTGERAFIVTLFRSPDLRAAHEELIAAVNQAYDSDSSSEPRQSRLSVLVSRLRNKFHRYGAEFPLKSVHRWGYMFSGKT